MTKAKLLLISQLLLLSMPAQADNSTIVSSGEFQTAVVELYTSEGCSSCPPADRWLSQLIEVPESDLNVLALAFHVDYWDYIGWKDEFASPRHTDRQRRLARLNRQSSIYTPEFFVDGLEARGTLSILDKIRSANKTRSAVSLQLAISAAKEQYHLRLTSHNNVDDMLRIQFVVFEDDLSNQIQRGENEGKELRHQRVVRYLSPPQTLEPEIQHSINIQPAWNQNKLGIAALVKTSKEEYMQSVYTLVRPTNE